MTTIKEVLYEDSLKYLHSLDREQLIELVQEHRSVKRTLAASRLLENKKGGN